MPASDPHHLDFMAALGKADFDLTDIAGNGLPMQVVDEVLRTGLLTASEINRLILPDGISAPDPASGRLSSLQSDRLVRILKIVKKAEETFANREKAHSWLRRSTTSLKKSAPLDLLDTDAGSHEVEILLERIDHGSAA